MNTLPKERYIFKAFNTICSTCGEGHRNYFTRPCRPELRAEYV